MVEFDIIQETQENYPEKKHIHLSFKEEEKAYKAKITKYASIYGIANDLRLSKINEEYSTPMGKRIQT